MNRLLKLLAIGQCSKSFNQEEHSRHHESVLVNFAHIASNSLENCLLGALTPSNTSISTVN
jgi:hypothetical protein